MPKRTLGPGSLAIGPSATPRQWAGDTTKITLTPSTDAEDDIPYLDGSNELGEITTSWELGVTITENYELDSLQAWCLENAGKEEPFVWTPNDDGEVSISGTVQIAPIGFGGDVKKKNTQDATFKVKGQPTLAEKV